MTRETTLRKVDEAMASGDFGLARDRLQGLLASYPDDLTLRSRLGGVYWKLQNPTMAGRYWFLEESTSPAMVTAKEAFERSCGHSAQRMLQQLKFKGDVESIDVTYAGRTLLDLQIRAANARRPADLAGVERNRQQEFKAAMTFYSCLFIAVSTALLFFIGIVFVLSKYIH